jgi:xanthine dehydrogenase accessory factor
MSVPRLQTRSASFVAGDWLAPLGGEWVEAAAAYLSKHAAVARVTVIALRGSAPREPGASMLVGLGGTLGTIGGGRLEWQAIQAARELLRDRNAAPVLIDDLVLGPDLGQCCGGRVELWLERLTRGDLPWLREATHRLRGASGVSIATDVAGRVVSHRVLPPVPGAADLNLQRFADGHPTPQRSAAPDPALRRSAAGDPVLEHSTAGHLPQHRSMGGNPTPQRSTSDNPTLQRSASGNLTLQRSTSSDLTLLEVLRPQRLPLWIFGAGHVGQALIRLLSPLDLFDITWVDSRPGLLPSGLPDCVTTQACAAPTDRVDTAPPGTHYVVLTHDHALDYELCRLILARADAGWLGLIGSASKSARFRSRLLRDGISRERLSALNCPIGIDGIASKLPAAIAIAIAAQLLQQHAGAMVTGRRRAKQHSGAMVTEPPLSKQHAGAMVTEPLRSKQQHACGTSCESCGAKRFTTP